MGAWFLRADRVGEPLVWNLNTDRGPAMIHRASCGSVKLAAHIGWEQLPESFERLGLLDVLVRDAYNSANGGHHHLGFCRRCVMEP
jgi:hypothetical protein